MEFYRLILRRVGNRIEVSNISKETMSEEEFSKMSWEYPIIQYWDGKHLHLLSLVEDYLFAFRDGVIAAEKLRDM